MKTEEDEAFDELARRQGAWGGGYQAKRAMAADKLQGPEREALKLALEALESSNKLINGTDTKGGLEDAIDGYYRGCFDVDGNNKLLNEAITTVKAALAQPVQQEAIYGMNQDDWKDVIAAITKVRDGRDIYLGCRPADVFQDWFLALGTAKVKEKNT
jgi:hypothetical protein